MSIDRNITCLKLGHRKETMEFSSGLHDDFIIMKQQSRNNSLSSGDAASLLPALRTEGKKDLDTKPPLYLPETPTKRPKNSDEEFLRQNQVPLVFREPNVFTGYRETGQPWSYYAKSIFCCHNESVNVWTHLAAFIFSLWLLLTEYLPQVGYGIEVWPYIAGYLTSCGLFLCSIAAHLLHSRTEYNHYLLFMLDYAGVGLYGTGTGIQHLFYCGEDAFFQKVRNYYLPVIVSLSVFHVWVSCYYKVKYDRPYPKIRKIAQIGSVLFMYFWICYPLFSRFHHCFQEWSRHDSGASFQSCDPALSLHLKQIGWFAAAGLFYGANIPERIWPGKFDFIGHGHQVFHVCIMMTAYYASAASFMDMQKRLNGPDTNRLPQNWFSCLWPLLAVSLSEASIIYYLSGKALEKIANRGKKQDENFTPIGNGCHH